MVVHDLDIVSVLSPPSETQPPLIVDADTVLSFSGSLERLEPVGGRNGQIDQILGIVEHPELSPGDLLDGQRDPPGNVPKPYRFRFAITKRLYHLDNSNAAR